MAHATAVILVVGLTERTLAHMPRVAAFAKARRILPVRPVFPAVTCPVQSSMLTGTPVREHGIVANGWFERDACEVQFWKQSNGLVRAEKVWETARRRDPNVTTANICWWFNMYSTVEYSLTPRPIYAADGRKFRDCYTEPPDLRERVQSELGPFPLFQFWGPGASLDSSRWIAEATRRVVRWHDPTLTLTYIPHLDYDLQRFGPSTPRAQAACAQVDPVIADLIEFFSARATRVMLVSEYGIEDVDRPVHVNRVLREAGLLRIREERGGEILDAGASRAFAVCDHQCAHVYVRDAEQIPRVFGLLSEVPGVRCVLEADGQRQWGLDHRRSGDLVLVADRGAWFAYPYWLDDRRAPDFARTVDIHRKPGYDPCELFIDPSIRFPGARLSARLLARSIGFRTLLDVVPLDASLVGGSHGRLDTDPVDRPLLIVDDRCSPPNAGAPLSSMAVRDAILGHLFGAV